MLPSRGGCSQLILCNSQNHYCSPPLFHFFLLLPPQSLNTQSSQMTIFIDTQHRRRGIRERKISIGLRQPSPQENTLGSHLDTRSVSFQVDHAHTGIFHFDRGGRSEGLVLQRGEKSPQKARMRYNANATIGTFHGLLQEILRGLFYPCQYLFFGNEKNDTMAVRERSCVCPQYFLFLPTTGVAS